MSCFDVAVGKAGSAAKILTRHGLPNPTKPVPECGVKAHWRMGSHPVAAREIGHFDPVWSFVFFWIGFCYIHFVSQKISVPNVDILK